MSKETVRLPARYAIDWNERCGMEGDWLVEVERSTPSARVVTVTLDAEALADLIDDAKRYTSATMRREFIADGYRGLVLSADATLRRLAKEGLLR